MCGSHKMCGSFRTSFIFFLLEFLYIVFVSSTLENAHLGKAGTCFCCSQSCSKCTGTWCKVKVEIFMEQLMCIEFEFRRKSMKSFK